MKVLSYVFALKMKYYMFSVASESILFHCFALYISIVWHNRSYI